MAGPVILQIFDPDIAPNGDYRSLTTADLMAAAAPDAALPSYVQGTNGATPERLATRAEQVAQTELLEQLAPPLGAWTDHDPITVPAEPAAAQQLPSVACSEIKFVADAANTQKIYVGGSAVSSTKSQDLSAREVEIVKRVSNANAFYVVAATTHTGQKLRYQTR